MNDEYKMKMKISEARRASGFVPTDRKRRSTTQFKLCSPSTSNLECKPLSQITSQLQYSHSSSLPQRSDSISPLDLHESAYVFDVVAAGTHDQSRESRMSAHGDCLSPDSFVVFEGQRANSKPRKCTSAALTLQESNTSQELLKYMLVVDGDSPVSTPQSVETPMTPMPSASELTSV